MDVRHFELQDLLSEALIALEAGDQPAVEALLRRALAWVERDWLSTPGEIRTGASGSTPPPEDDQDDD
jgi:hypothetical protein